MKTIMKTFVSVAAVAMTLVSCMKNEMEKNVSPEVETSYTFIIGNADDDSEADSKAVIGAECVEWENGDRLGTYTTTEVASDDKSASVNKYSLVTVAEGSPVTVSIYAKGGLAEGDMIYCYYPYSSANDEAEMTAVAMSVPVSQTEKNAMPMASIPFEVQTLSEVNNTSYAGEINVVNLGSIIEFNIYSTTPAYQSEFIQSVTFDADNAVAGEFNFDLTSVNYSDESTLEISGFEETSVTMTPSDPVQVGALKNEAAKINMVVAPGSHSGNIIVTTDKAVYTFPMTAAKEFSRSTVKPLGLNLRYDIRKEFNAVTFDFTDPAGYGITPSPTAGSGVDATVINVEKVTFTPIPGSEDANKVLIYTQETNESLSYFLKSYKNSAVKFSVQDGYVMTSMSVSGTNRANLVPDSGIYESGEWTGSAQSVTFSLSGVADIKSVSVSYETGTPKQQQTLSFSSTECSVDLGEEFDEPELTGAHTSVSYSSSDTEVATVDETGAVTVLTVGTTTITATAAEDETYAPAKASYTLVVNTAASDKVKTIPWVEDFTGAKSDDNYLANNYVAANGGDNTRTYSGSSSGGETPELIIGKSNGSLTAQINSGEYKGMLTLTFKSNHPDYISVTSSTEGVEVAKVTDTEYIITLASAGIFDLTLTNVKSSNARVDDISLTEGALLSQTLEFSSTAFSYTIGVNAPDDFDEPELTGAQTTVSYSSDNAEVAAVDPETGEVTLGETAGVAVITATAAGTSEYKEASVSYSITLSTPSQTSFVDVLTREVTGVTSYADWSGKSVNIAVYAGNSSRYTSNESDAIQLRSTDNSGVVTTLSGGYATKISVKWNAGTNTERILQVYGSMTPYSSASDLYGDAAGVLLGELAIAGAVESVSELEISRNIPYIGFRSKSGALYLDEVKVYWSTTPAETSSLSSISVESPKTGYKVGDAFEKPVVTAVYEDASTMEVQAEFTGYDMSAAGEQTVTVTYTEGGVTKTTTYTIIVNALLEEPEALNDVTVSEFIAASVSESDWYLLTGKITAITDATNGRFTIQDDTASVPIYNMTNGWVGENDKSFAAIGLKVGDEVTLGTLRSEYNGNAQGGGSDVPAYYISHTPCCHTPEIVFSGNEVTINCQTLDATVRYTTDGNDPDESSPVYNSPFTLGANATVKAIAVKTGCLDSEVAQLECVLGSVSYTLMFGTGYNQSKVNDYETTWAVRYDDFECTLANWSNYNNGWNYVKAGRGGTASVATITTSSPIQEAMTTVTMTVDAVTKSKIKSLKLYVSSDAGFTSPDVYSATPSTGDVTFSITNPVPAAYYKIEVDCDSGSSNGLITVSKVVFSN